MIDTGYVRDPADVTLLPGVPSSLREARGLGFELVVVSNQSGVARGIISSAELEAVERRFEELLAQEGVVLDHVRFCIHGPNDGCRCRKPAAGMLEDTATARSIDLRRSVMVGDRDSDVLAGRSAGCRTIIVGGGASMNADYSATSFTDVPSILRRIVADHPES